MSWATVLTLADLVQLQDGDDQERHPEEVAHYAQLRETEDKGVVRGQLVVLRKVLESDAQKRTGPKHGQPLRPGADTLGCRLFGRRDGSTTGEVGSHEDRRYHRDNQDRLGAAQATDQAGEAGRQNAQHAASRTREIDAVDEERGWRPQEESIPYGPALAPSQSEKG